MIDRIQTSNINLVKAGQNNKKPSFKGAGVAGLSLLKWLNDSPAMGACAVDLCSMVIPRTAIEWKNRGPQSGTETMIREGTSNLIHTCVGMIGLLAATVISKTFNKEYGIKAQNIFASSKTIQNMTQIWNASGGNQEEFFKGFLNNLEGLNGSEWKSISENVKAEVSDGLIQLSDKTKQLSAATGPSRKQLSEEIKELKELLKTKIVKNTGAQANFKLKASEGAKEISAGFTELMDNAVAISNAFSSDKAKENLPKFIEALKKNKNAATILGIGICAILCASVQPVNRWLTKRRTGSDGFVGVDNGKQKEPKNTDGKKKIPLYKAIKYPLGIGFSLGAIRTIGKYSDLLSNIQFNSKVPTLNQFKFLYGLTIASRFMSARDGNELREAVIKDTLGYTNWLILGGMVSKLTARGIGGKELINNPLAQDGAKKGIKYAFKWLTQASVKSYDEILLPKAKEFIKDGKNLKFSELLKNADADTKKKIFKIGAAQCAGYLYSGLVLGAGIAKLNIFITKRLNARKKAKDKMRAEMNSNNININIPKQYKEQISPVFKVFE